MPVGHPAHIPALPQGLTVPLVSNCVSTHELPVLLTAVTRSLVAHVFGCVPGDIMDMVRVAAGSGAAGL